MGWPPGTQVVPVGRERLEYNGTDNRIALRKALCLGLSRPGLETHSPAYQSVTLNNSFELSEL